jgi:hypothetical protein
MSWDTKTVHSMWNSWIEKKETLENSWGRVTIPDTYNVVTSI